jgi:putative nucleotidyltransferase with HDIG domain
MNVEPTHTVVRDIRAEIQRINEVVSFPPVVAEILQAMSDQNVTTTKVITLIESDQGLTAKILRVANSPFYGLRSDVTNIAQALRMLGLDEIGHLLLTCQMKSRLMSLNTRQQLRLETLWKHSVAAASVSRLLANRFRLPTDGKEYTAGLLHDMGKLVLIQYFPDQYAAIESLITTASKKDIDAELELISITHTEIGKQIGEKWRLPKEYLDVMLYHHRPASSSNHSLLTAVVRLADLFCEQWGFGIAEQAEGFSIDTDCLSILAEADVSFKTMPIEQLGAEMRSEFEKNLEMIEILS